MVKKFKKALTLVLLFVASISITVSAVKESTFVIIKPDYAKDPEKAAGIISMIEKKAMRFQ